MASRGFVHERCFVAQVQHKDTLYEVSIPYRMCEDQHSDRIEGVLKCVQHAHPRPDVWDSRLKMFNLESAAWTALNGHLLPQQLYVGLSQSGIQ